MPASFLTGKPYKLAPMGRSYGISELKPVAMPGGKGERRAPGYNSPPFPRPTGIP